LLRHSQEDRHHEHTDDRPVEPSSEPPIIGIRDGRDEHDRCNHDQDKLDKRGYERLANLPHSQGIRVLRSL
jgi:hypothetical protein